MSICAHDATTEFLSSFTAAVVATCQTGGRWPTKSIGPAEKRLRRWGRRSVSQQGEKSAMDEDHRSTLNQSKKVCDESQAPRDDAKIITAESVEATEQRRQAIIKLRSRRKKRTVIIK